MTSAQSTSQASESARTLHRRALVFDCLALNYVLEDPYTTRMIEGGVDAINVTIATEDEDWDETLRLTERSLELIERDPRLIQAFSAADVRSAKQNGQVAVILGTQGASMLGTHLWRLDVLHRLGFRFFAPAYTGASLFADGCGEFRDAGLSVMGQDLIERLNALPMIVDLSHCGHKSRWEAAQLAAHPACTHSNAYSVHHNDRNTKDETIQIIAEKGGVVGICGLVRSVASENATLAHMLDHLQHVVRLVGWDHVGLGCDFIEAFQDRSSGDKPAWNFIPKWRRVRPDIFGTFDEFYNLSYPEGFESVSVLANFTQGMRDRGHSDDQVMAALGGNWVRQLEAVTG